MNRLIIVLLVCIISLPSYANTYPNSFSIGNSLTADYRYWELPSWENGDVHYDGGQSAWYIYNHPEEQAEMNWGQRWDQVTKSYDYLIIQFDAHPTQRPTFEQDLEAAQGFIDAIPTPNVVLYTGWQYHTYGTDPQMVVDYESGEVNVNTHTPAYYNRLANELSTLYPTKTIQRTRHMDVMYDIAKNPPFSDWNEPGNNGAWRDPKHGTQGNIHWFAQQLIREVMGIPYQLTTESEVYGLQQQNWTDWLTYNYLGDGDADGNGIVDGFDFLEIQRGATLNPYFDYINWDKNFGAAPPMPTVLGAFQNCERLQSCHYIPEPSTFNLVCLLLAMVLLCYHFRNRGERDD